MKSMYRYVATFFLGLMLSTQCVDLYAAATSPAEEAESVAEIREEGTELEGEAEEAAAEEEAKLSFPRRMWRKIRRHKKKSILFAIVAILILGEHFSRKIIANTIFNRMVTNKTLEAGKKPAWFHELVMNSKLFPDPVVWLERPTNPALLESWVTVMQEYNAQEARVKAFVEKVPEEERAKLYEVANYLLFLVSKDEYGRPADPQIAAIMKISHESAFLNKVANEAGLYYHRLTKTEKWKRRREEKKKKDSMAGQLR